MKEFNRWYNDYIRKLRRFLEPLAAMFDARPFSSAIDEKSGRIRLAAPFSKLDLAKFVASYNPPPGLMRAFVENDEGLLGDWWPMAGLYTHGLRVFQPGRTELDALSQTTVNVRWGEYRQPFGTFCVAFPDGYFREPVSEDVGRPVGCIGRFDPKFRLFALHVCAVGPRRSTLYDLALPLDDGNIEEYALRDVIAPSIIPAEHELLHWCRRVLMNSCLLLTNYGFREATGPKPLEFKKKLSRERRDELEREHFLASRTYAIDQRITLYETHGGDPDRHTDHHVRPHWRRGHWANLAVGSGRAERRLTFRKPCLVRADLFAGVTGDTTSTYRTN